MPERSASEAVEGARLHPASIVMWWYRDLRIYAVALVPLLFGGDLDTRLAIPAAIGALDLGAALLRFARFRYRAGPDGLVLEGGLLGRWRKVLPRARIQSVDTVQKLRHRLFRVVEVRVEVIGGRDTEGALVAVRAAEAERLRAVLLGEAPARVDGIEPPPLARLTIGELLLAGITGGGVPVIALILSQVSDALPEDALERAVEGTESVVGPGWVAIAAFVLGIALLTFAISMTMTVLVYWDFTVRREGDRLAITRGILEKRRAYVPLRRVQAIHLRENLVRRMLGLASLTVTVAGYAGQQQEQKESSVLLPMARRDAALTLAMGLLPEPVDLRAVSLVPAPPRALRRRVVRALVVAGVAIAVLVWRLGPGGWWGAALVPAGIVRAFLGWRALGHAVAGRYVLVRSGWLERKTSVVPAANVQALGLSATPTQRLARLADLRLRIPKARATAYDLDRARAEAVFAEVRAAMTPA